MGIILASASPRRQELLKQIGCDFTIKVSDIVEDNQQDLLPQQLAVSHAKAKAVDISLQGSANDVIIGADTIVVLDGQVYGKPININDARSILTHLSGKQHQVITGIAVVYREQVWTDFVVTNVKIGNLTSKEIENYLATGEPMDKAGAYGIQGMGALLVEEIQGCYFNVVGLPLRKLSEVLRKAGVHLL